MKKYLKPGFLVLLAGLYLLSSGSGATAPSGGPAVNFGAGQVTINNDPRIKYDPNRGFYLNGPYVTGGVIKSCVNNPNDNFCISPHEMEIVLAYQNSLLTPNK